MGERRFVIREATAITKITGYAPCPEVTESELKRRFIEATETIIQNHDGEMVNWYEVLPVLLHGEAKEQPDVWEAFIAVGWKLSHYIANGEICSDRSCFRCRLADLLFDAEKRMPRKEQP